MLVYKKNLFASLKVGTKHGRMPLKVCSQHINADNCGYSHIRKSENTDNIVTCEY